MAMSPERAGARSHPGSARAPRAGRGPPRTRLAEPRAGGSERTPEREPTIESIQLAATAAWLAEQKKGEDVRVYDVSKHLRVADYFVLVTGLNRPHVKAIQQELHLRLKEAGATHERVEGEASAWWVLLDYIDVVVHVMQPEARAYYDLDRLYQDCPEIDWRAVERVPLEQPVARTGP